ncbi:MAG: RNA-binding protein, partial [Lachnospiraceae bacterium]|nr:RNA-binding protein [Lachnospiraceae bacterium]
MELTLGKKQVLTIVKQVEFGVYLGTEKEKVLLPKKQVPEGAEPGDPVEVFLYKDSQDRLIATTNTPLLTLGELAVLEVAETGKYGAFLKWGLEKDLFLPFKEQTSRVKKGDKCLVTLYVDKSQRLCATMRVYELLRKDSEYKKDDMVTGIVYETSQQFGAFVAV